MSGRDLLLINAVGVIWGFNFVVTKWALAGWAGEGASAAFTGAPPLFFAAVRFVFVALVLAPLLRPIPREWGRVALIAMAFGVAHFALMYWGLERATPSAAAVAIQLTAPLTVILSVLALGERVGVRRGIGIAMAFAGVAAIAYRPDAFALSIGLALVAGAALAAATGSILVKQLKDPPGALRMQAWVAAWSAGPMLAASALTETGQAAALAAGGWGLWAAIAYVAIGAAMFGHGAYYFLLRRYDASLVAPLGLTAPLWAMVFGVTILHDPLTPRLMLGALLTLGGVAVMAARPKAPPRPETAAHAVPKPVPKPAPGPTP